MTTQRRLANDDHPRPQLVRDHWTSLDGSWDFGVGTDEHQPLSEVDFDQEILVPFPPESTASGLHLAGFIPVVWYRRCIDATTMAASGYSPDRPRLVLHFGAVDYTATVWLGGHRLGEHAGGHSPFAFDVTDILTTATEPVELIVRALDDPLDTEQPRGKQDWHKRPHSIWYGRTTGIWQPVWLEATPVHAIGHIQWTPDVAASRVNLTIDFAARTPHGSHLAIRLETEDSALPLADHSVQVDGRSWAGSVTIPALRNGQALEELLWSPEHPRLVHASIKLTTPEGTDSVTSYFGIRSVGVSEESFLLNGRPYFVRGVLEQGFWPEHHLASPSSAALRTEVELIKALGFNTARVHQKAEDPRFLYWADRVGLLIWSEAPSAYTFSSRAVQQTMREWADIIHRDASHPSIVAWVPLNESWGVHHIRSEPRQKSYSLALAAMTRALDPSRPVISNDGWEHTDSDIITIHDYSADTDLLAQRYGTLAAARSQLRGDGPERRPVVLPEQGGANRPVLLSEFGGVSYDPTGTPEHWGYSTAATPEQFARQLSTLVGAVSESSGLAGFCYTQLTDTGQETNGLLFADRTPKIPIADIRAAITATTRKQSAHDGLELPLALSPPEDPTG